MQAKRSKLDILRERLKQMNGVVSQIQQELLSFFTKFIAEQYVSTKFLKLHSWLNKMSSQKENLLHKTNKLEKWADTRYEEYHPDQFKTRYKTKFKNLQSEVDDLEKNYEELNQRALKKGKTLKKTIKQQKDKIIEALKFNTYFFVPLRKEKLEFIQQYESQFLHFLRNSEVYKIESIEFQIQALQDRIKVYPGEAQVQKVQSLVVSQIQKIVVFQQYFREWEFKVISTPHVQNLMDYWKEPCFIYELNKTRSRIKIVSMHQLSVHQFLRKIRDQCNLSKATSLQIQKCHCRWLVRKLKKIEEKLDVVIHAQDFVIYIFGLEEDKREAKRQIEMLLSQRANEKQEIIIEGIQLQKAIQSKLKWLRYQIYQKFLVTLEYMGESIIIKGEKKIIAGAAKMVKDLLMVLSKEFKVIQLKPRHLKMLKAFPGTKQLLLRLEIDIVDEKDGIITGHQDKIDQFIIQMKDISQNEEVQIEVDGLQDITNDEFKQIQAKARQIHFCQVKWSQEEDDCAVIKGFFPQNVKSELQKLKLQKKIQEKEEEEEKLNQDKLKLENDLKNEKRDKEKLQKEMNKIKVPDNWDPMGGNKYILIDIAQGAQQFKFVENRFHQTMGNQIVRLQRIQNPELWKRVKLQQEFIRSEGRDPKVRYMFHGTRNNHPSLIYDNHIGFDFRFSNQGAWGVGSYFAHNASYSGGGYQHTLPNGNKCLFLVYVVQGDPFKTGGGNYRIPPFKNGPNGPRYDSVSSNDGTIVIVYEHGKAYPYYLIEYK